MGRTIPTDTNEGLSLDFLCTGTQPSNLFVPGGGWVGSGVGSPLGTHAFWDRLGAVCPPDTIVTGMKFQRGGCDRGVMWTDGVMDLTQCPALDMESREGLMTFLECSPINTTGIAFCSCCWLLSLLLSLFVVVYGDAHYYGPSLFGVLLTGYSLTDLGWSFWGSGGPLTQHSYFERVGGFCREGVMTGIRFKRYSNQQLL